LPFIEWLEKNLNTPRYGSLYSDLRTVYLLLQLSIVIGKSLVDPKFERLTNLAQIFEFKEEIVSEPVISFLSLKPKDVMTPMELVLLKTHLMKVSHEHKYYSQIPDYLFQQTLYTQFYFSDRRLEEVMTELKPGFIEMKSEENLDSMLLVDDFGEMLEKNFSLQEIDFFIDIFNDIFIEKNERKHDLLFFDDSTDNFEVEEDVLFHMGMFIKKEFSVSDTQEKIENRYNVFIDMLDYVTNGFLFNKTKNLEWRMNNKIFAFVVDLVNEMLEAEFFDKQEDLIHQKMMGMEEAGEELIESNDNILNDNDVEILVKVFLDNVDTEFRRKLLSIYSQALGTFTSFYNTIQQTRGGGKEDIIDGKFGITHWITEIENRHIGRYSKRIKSAWKRMKLAKLYGVVQVLYLMIYNYPIKVVYPQINKIEPNGGRGGRGGGRGGFRGGGGRGGGGRGGGGRGRGGFRGGRGRGRGGFRGGRGRGRGGFRGGRGRGGRMWGFRRGFGWGWWFPYLLYPGLGPWWWYLLLSSKIGEQLTLWKTQEKIEVVKPVIVKKEEGETSLIEVRGRRGGGGKRRGGGRRGGRRRTIVPKRRRRRRRSGRRRGGRRSIYGRRFPLFLRRMVRILNPRYKYYYRWDPILEYWVIDPRFSSYYGYGSGGLNPGYYRGGGGGRGSYYLY